MSEPKFRVTCEWCGERQPRATTAWTVRNWMHQHAKDKHATAAQPTTTEAS